MPAYTAGSVGFPDKSVGILHAITRVQAVRGLLMSRLMRIALPCLLVGFAAAAGACGTDVRTEDPPPPAPRATWYQDVAPIVAKHCMGCHQEGGIGPMELTSYDSASENALR